MTLVTDCKFIIENQEMKCTDCCEKWLKYSFCGFPTFSFYYSFSWDFISRQRRKEVIWCIIKFFFFEQKTEYRLEINQENLLFFLIFLVESNMSKNIGKRHFNAKFRYSEIDILPLRKMSQTLNFFFRK